ncbi:hypothetical protein NA78x_001028 [Anatilimnocola sp. NA78]|uniref:hypothetical protein n=1 Tax=Anatilimnocola sp. NA78 TaxID=3415683 RepID=UPI003CE58446
MLRFTGMLLFVALTGLLGGAVYASSETQAAAEPQLHEGTVVSAGTGQVSMKTADGKEHVFKTNDTTRITVNGKPGKLEDLKPGIQIRVMTDQMNKVTSISTVDDRKRL